MRGEDRDELRRLAALSMLWGLLAAAKEKADVVTWRREGGPEATDFLRALETGAPHPLLLKWQELKATVAANRPVPSLREQNTRRLAVLMVETLVRTGLGKEPARRRAAKAVEHLFPTTNKRTIKCWQRNYSIGADDERLIAMAIERHGHDHDRLVANFAGLIDWTDNPVVAWNITRRPPPGG
jgi:hypothetical protein